MKKGIHPNYYDVEVTCSCGNKFNTKSTVGKPCGLKYAPHAIRFIQANKKIVDTAGRVERFRQKYATLPAKLIHPCRALLLR